MPVACKISVESKKKCNVLWCCRCGKWRKFFQKFNDTCQRRLLFIRKQIIEIFFSAINGRFHMKEGHLFDVVCIYSHDMLCSQLTGQSCVFSWKKVCVRYFLSGRTVKCGLRYRIYEGRDFWELKDLMGM